MNRTVFYFEYPDLGDQGVATRDDIDKTLRLGMNHPMGPLQLGSSSSSPCVSILITYLFS